jgi:hypothetical protein
VLAAALCRERGWRYVVHTDASLPAEVERANLVVLAAYRPAVHANAAVLAWWVARLAGGGPDSRTCVQSPGHCPASRARLTRRAGRAVRYSRGRCQGDCARCVGLRKNLFDLRPTAVVHNLHVLTWLAAAQPRPAA